MFYGWKIVFASVFGLSMSHGVLTVLGFGVFIVPLTEAFGWSRTQLSLTVAIATYTVAAVSPFVGAGLDHFGVRRLLSLSILAFGLIFGSMYFFNASILVFYLMYMLLSIPGTTTVPISYSRLIVNWFDRRRGLALGISLAGVGFGTAAVPKFIQAIVEAWSWREAYLAIGLLLVFVCLPIVYFIVRDRPQVMGLLPDGDEPGKEATPDMTLTLGMTNREALRTRQYWMMQVIFFLLGISLLGIIVHMIPMLVGRGVSPHDAATTASMIGISLLFGRVIGGALMDHFFAPWVAIGFMTGPVIGLVLFALGATGSGAILCAVLIGLAQGAEFDVIGYFVSRYFGLRAYGKIFSQIFAFFQVGCGLGPVLMGITYDTIGTYTIALWGLAAITTLAIILIAMLGPYPDFGKCEPTTGKLGSPKEANA